MTSPWNAQTPDANKVFQSKETKCTRAKSQKLLPFLFLPDAYATCWPFLSSENALGHKFSSTQPCSSWVHLPSAGDIPLQAKPPFFSQVLSWDSHLPFWFQDISSTDIISKLYLIPSFTKGTWSHIPLAIFHPRPLMGTPLFTVAWTQSLRLLWLLVKELLELPGSWSPGN